MLSGSWTGDWRTFNVKDRNSRRAIFQRRKEQYERLREISKEDLEVLGIPTVCLPD